MFGKYNGFVSKARVSACMYFLVVYFNIIRMNLIQYKKLKTLALCLGRVLLNRIEFQVALVTA